ncbi:MAG: dipeptide ABC transporter ATP-binding protein [Lentisphaeria bacterium]|nr:dipeptide ABC transporter ATP-binding protein [Lentisphaeria bacterium]
MALLEVKDLKKYYSAGGGFFSRKKFVKAVDGVSFTLEEGETLGLVGESGCGKSTLARVLLRLEEPQSGSIVLDGTDLCALKGEKLRRRRGDFQMIFQDPYASLNPRRSIYSTLEEPLLLHTHLDEAGRKERIGELLDMVGLHREHAGRYPHQFSGGQRQRIGIARALAVNPRFIVADEPVSALDVSVQAQIVNLLQDIQKQTKTAFLFIAHDLAVVEHISNRIMVMYLGKVMEMGDVRLLCSTPAHPYTEALLASVPVLDPAGRGKKKRLTGDVPSPLAPPEGCRFHPRCPYAEKVCMEKEPEMREIGPGHWCCCHFAEKSR